MAGRQARIDQVRTFFPHGGAPTNPAPMHSVLRLKYIGPHFASRFTLRDIDTLQALLTYTREHTRAQNSRLLNTVLNNPRRNNCLPPPRRMQPRPCPCNYHVRIVNRMAYNAIVHYLLRRNVPLNRIPIGLQRPRTPMRAYPNRCGTRAAPRARRAAPRRGRGGTIATRTRSRRAR